MAKIVFMPGGEGALRRDKGGGDFSLASLVPLP